MKAHVVSASAVLFSISCMPRQYNAQTNSTDVFTDVDPLAFNALKMWETKGDVKAIYEYPSNFVRKVSPNLSNSGYDFEDKAVEADDIFFVAKESFIKTVPAPTRYPDKEYDVQIGVPTRPPLCIEDAPVTGDILRNFEGGGLISYENIRTKKNLTLKFTPVITYTVPENELTTFNADEIVIAQQECKRRGLRLPTLRETFDFCFAGEKRDANGDFSKSRCKDPSSNYFLQKNLLTISLNAAQTRDSWKIDLYRGKVVSDISIRAYLMRDKQITFRCVGKK